MSRDRYYVLPALDGPPGPTMTFRGRRVVQWAINNYLGLAERPELIEAAREAAGRWGISAPMGSRFMTGNSWHERLEERLARFFGTPSAMIFAKSLPLVIVEVLLKALDLVESKPHLVDRLWANARKLQCRLRGLGFDLGETQSAITPVYLPIDGVDTAMKVVRKMRDEKGVFLSAVMHPVVPRGVVLCRLVPSASHTDEDVAVTIRAFRETRDELGLTMA
jgi:7-keto-8-aminopelargonate synthetase-like enzyme